MLDCGWHVPQNAFIQTLITLMKSEDDKRGARQLIKDIKFYDWDEVAGMWEMEIARLKEKVG